ncbi:MAG: TIGR03620 family F420-dependent LLM class oxidoreductase, partial [Ilumatobacteraceae bacterium]
RVRELGAELEAMGWPCLWRPETAGRDVMVSSATILDATTTLKMATGIAQIHARNPLTTAAAQKTLHEASGGRFLLGLGVSHAPFVEGARKLDYSKPYTAMVDHLAGMKEAPFLAPTGEGTPTTVLAALGPKMLQLAATEADGAHPYFSPVEHTAYARDIMGAGPLLAPELMVAIHPERPTALALARHHMARYLALPNYTNNLLRHGFTDDDISEVSERLVDAIVVCGSIDDVVVRVAEHHDAGADHVCIQVLTDGTDLPMQHWQDLAGAFGLSAPAD